jgi:hypothetical protein
MAAFLLLTWAGIGQPLYPASYRQDDLSGGLLIYFLQSLHENPLELLVAGILIESSAWCSGWGWSS